MSTSQLQVKGENNLKNVAEFPQAKDNINRLFEIWKTLEGNAESFEPLGEGTHDVIVTKAIERDSAKGNPMKEIVWQDVITGREGTTYTMKRGKGDKPFFDYTPVSEGDQYTVKHTIKNGFSSVKILRESIKKLDSLPPRPTTLSKNCIRQTLFIFDIEVFKHDILIECKDYFTGEWYEFNNDLDGFRTFYLENRDSLFVGYNNSGYDNHVIRGYLQGKNPYVLSKIIINSEGNEDRNKIYRAYNNRKTTLFSMDLYMDNRGFSLKEHSGFLGIDIRETQVDFDLDRPLTEDEKAKNKFYCRNDVLATEKRLEQNSGMLLAKMVICAMFNLDKRSIGMTNANLTGALLGAVKVNDRGDELKPYELPSVLNFTDETIYNNYVGHDLQLNDNDKPDLALEVNKRDLTLVFGAGGIHGAKESYIRVGKFHFRDVGSLYPNTMLQFNYLSRNIPEKKLHIYNDLVTQRMHAKYSNEKTTLVNGVEVPTKVLINGIKLPLNTKYGAMGAKFNVLFDKRMRLHVCITGQLALYDLFEKIEPHATIIQSNTDAHAFIPFTPEDETIIDNICKEWAERTGYTLDDDLFHAIYQKDVNNYIAVDADNHVKIKGAIGLTGGLKISKAVVSNAFINYVLTGYDYIQFINQCSDIRQFQIITKTGYSFDDTILIDSLNNEHSTNKVNRVFAIKDPYNAVYLYKVKEQTFYSEREVIDFYTDLDDSDELTDYQRTINETLVNTKVSEYHEKKDINGEWYERSLTKGVAKAPDNYGVSNEEIGSGITLDEIDKQYYINEVEDLLIMWFGDNWKERLEESHKEYEKQGFEPLEVKNYID